MATTSRSLPILLALLASMAALFALLAQLRSDAVEPNAQAAAPAVLELTSEGEQAAITLHALDVKRPGGEPRGAAAGQRQALRSATQASLEDRVGSALGALGATHALRVEGCVVDGAGFPREGVAVLAGLPFGSLNRVAYTDESGAFSFALVSTTENADLVVAVASDAIWSGLFRVRASASSTFTVDLELPQGSGAAFGAPEIPDALAVGEELALLATTARTAVCERPPALESSLEVLVRLQAAGLEDQKLIAAINEALLSQNQQQTFQLLQLQSFEPQIELLSISERELLTSFSFTALPDTQLVFQGRLENGVLTFESDPTPVFRAEIDVRDESGMPVPYASISQLGSHGRVLVVQFADEKGHFAMDFVEGSHRLLAGAKKGANDETTLSGKAGETVTWHARLDPGRSVALALPPDEDGQPRASRYELEVRSRDSVWTRSAVPSEDGGMVFHHVPAGSARLLIFAQGNTTALPDQVVPVASSFLSTAVQSLAAGLPSASAATVWAPASHQDVDGPVRARLFDDETGRGELLSSGATDHARRSAPDPGRASASAPYMTGRGLRLVAGDDTTGLHDRDWINAASLPDGSSAPEVVSVISPLEPAIAVIGKDSEPLLIRLEQGVPVLYRAEKDDADASALQLPPGQWWVQPQFELNGSLQRLDPGSTVDARARALPPDDAEESGTAPASNAPDRELLRESCNRCHTGE